MQASRSGNILFDEVIKAYGFIQTFGEACIYKKVSGSSVAFLILYVDDILLIGNDIEFLAPLPGRIFNITRFLITNIISSQLCVGLLACHDGSR